MPLLSTPTSLLYSRAMTLRVSVCKAVVHQTLLEMWPKGLRGHCYDVGIYVAVIAGNFSKTSVLAEVEPLPEDCSQPRSLWLQGRSQVWVGFLFVMLSIIRILDRSVPDDCPESTPLHSRKPISLGHKWSRNYHHKVWSYVEVHSRKRVVLQKSELCVD
jgi:hypothetical protein